MRKPRYFSLCVAIVVLSSAVCGGQVGAAERATKQDSNDGQPKSEAATFVDKALAAEAAGDGKARADYLRQALDADPDYAPAHWQLGEIKVDNKWLATDSAAATSAWSKKITEYQQRRARAVRTADSQIMLAKWCESAGLEDQAKMHWRLSMNTRPTHNQQREIISKLGLVRHQKKLLPAAEASVLKKHEKELEAMTQKWKPILTRLRTDLDSRDVARQSAAAEKLKEIKDIAVIPVLETVFSKAQATAGKAVVAAIAEMPEIKASESLVRFAVLAENEQVRKSAAEALKSRDIFSFVPMLLAGLSNPIEISFQTFMGEGGIFGDRLSLYREGPEFNLALTSGMTAMPNYMPQPGAVMVPQTARAEQQVAVQAAADRMTAQAALAENARSAFVNERIVATLRIATDNDGLSDDAKDWWNWWSQYNEIHYSSDPQTYEINRSMYTYYSATPYYANQPYQSSLQSSSPSKTQLTQPTQQSTLPASAANRHYMGLNPTMHYDSGKIACFVPGTLVWTITGKMPIEAVQIGDLVLAQNVESGELAYKPVIQVTKGPPLPLVEIHTGEETIRCTYGHLFWVSGTGWRMAKELKVGDRLHTTKGTLAIDNVEKTGEASCHNLVVPEFDTYFVTDQQILVHDIDVRGPTTATVPGLVEKAVEK